MYLEVVAYADVFEPGMSTVIFEHRLSIGFDRQATEADQSDIPRLKINGFHVRLKMKVLSK